MLNLLVQHLQEGLLVPMGKQVSNLVQALRERAMVLVMVLRRLRPPMWKKRVVKRGAQKDLNNDDGMNDWLHEILRIPEETCTDVIIFETGEESSNEHDVAEIFSPPRIITVAKRRGLCGEWAIDRLIEKEPGVRWDLGRKDHQKACMELIERVKPGLVVGSPPCSWFSQMMNINWPRMDKARKRQMMTEAREHLRFACAVYESQFRAGRIFMHEHP